MLSFLHIDIQTACTLTNQSSSTHLWLTVEAGSQREPSKRVVELNDGCSNFAQIQLHLHRGSKGVTLLAYAEWAGIWPSRVPTAFLPPHQDAAPPPRHRIAARRQRKSSGVERRP